MEEFNKPAVVPTSEEHFPVAMKEEANAMESKNEDIFELLLLPDEIVMKIMGYLSTYDLLRIMAQVSKKFQKISQDPFLIKSINLRAQLKSLTEEEEEKFGDNFLDVVRRSEKLKFLSLNLIGWEERKFLTMFPSIGHHSLEEFWLKFDGMNERNFDFHSWNENVLKYLEQCSNLKILKIDFDRLPITEIGMVLRFNNLAFKNLKVLDLKFNKNYIRGIENTASIDDLFVFLAAAGIPFYMAWNMTGQQQQQMFLSSVSSITVKFPKLESLRLSLWLDAHVVMHNTLRYKFYNAVSQVAMEKNIKIEIVDLYKQ